jgi:hypothetical protein
VDISNLDSSPILGMARDKSRDCKIYEPTWEVRAEIIAQNPTRFDLGVTL